MLHDGKAPYPGAVETLVSLKAAGKHVVILSNSGKRSSPNEHRLIGLGFAPGSFDLFLTSGEVAWTKLENSLAENTLAAGAKCLLLARDDDQSAIEGLDLDRVADGAEADIIIIAGSRAEEISLEQYSKILAPAAARKVPCMCTNPDKLMLANGDVVPGAGQISELYQKLGGEVTWIGKPYPEIYAAALARLGNPPKQRTVCIGDSVEHDIAGGMNAGLKTALVRTGILADASHADMEKLFDQHKVNPDHIMPDLVWAH